MLTNRQAKEFVLKSLAALNEWKEAGERSRFQKIRYSWALGHPWIPSA